MANTSRIKFGVMDSVVTALESQERRFSLESSLDESREAVANAVPDFEDEDALASAILGIGTFLSDDILHGVKRAAVHEITDDFLVNSLASEVAGGGLSRQEAFDATMEVAQYLVAAEQEVA